MERNESVIQIEGKMSFKAYLQNVETKTGKSPEDFIKLAIEKGFYEDKEIKTGIKAAQITNWLKEDFELGHGHAMSIYAYLKGKRN